MRKEQENLLSVSGFAAAAGVTVRTLHHYDHLGLLKPSGRSRSGYRLYGGSDLARLQQIVTLRFIGFSLKQIRDILHRRTFDLAAALRRQREVIGEKCRQLQAAVRAIAEAERMLAVGGDTDWEKFRRIIEVIEMQKSTEWMKQYYGDEAWKKVEQRGAQWSPELQERSTREWTELFRDIEASLGEDPASEKAQALAARWRKLVEGFTGGDPGISAGLKNLYADRPNWPADLKEKMAPFGDPRVCEFISRAMACGKRSR